MQVRDLIAVHPDLRGSKTDVMIRASEEMLSCGQVCTACADACLAEDMVQQLRQCIRLDLDCADICFAAAKVATRQTDSNAELIAPLLTACIEACRRCADVCERHALEMNMEHCRICADACRRCEQACEAAKNSL